jgi:hypothetical protein
VHTGATGRRGNQRIVAFDKRSRGGAGNGARYASARDTTAHKGHGDVKGSGRSKAARPAGIAGGCAQTEIPLLSR